jgi:hypothetical protein
VLERDAENCSTERARVTTNGVDRAGGSTIGDSAWGKRQVLNAKSCAGSLGARTRLPLGVDESWAKDDGGAV